MRNVIVIVEIRITKSKDTEVKLSIVAYLGDLKGTSANSLSLVHVQLTIY